MSDPKRCRRCGHDASDHHEGGNCLAHWCDCPAFVPESDEPATIPPPKPAETTEPVPAPLWLSGFPSTFDAPEVLAEIEFPLDHAWAPSWENYRSSWLIPKDAFVFEIEDEDEEKDE